MKSFTGKFTSVRGWALLFTLFLGAGFFAVSCGEEEVPAPTTPAPPPPAPTPTPTPEPTGPATPTGLRASAGDGYIEWTWNGVEGVLGYQGQFSADAVFTAADTTFLIVAPQTSHRVHNQTSGYFRVRSGVGASVTDLQYSDWSDAVRGITEPPAAVPLSVPGSVAAGSPRDATITVTWDAVADAEAYEVQRQDGGSWTSASCGGAGNRVTGIECVAGGLDSGTAYAFRVRAVPATSATGSAPSAWSSSATATTTGRAAVSVEPGGLNLLWKSEFDLTQVSDTTYRHAITWNWDPVEDRALQPLIDHYAALLGTPGIDTSTNPRRTDDECPSLDSIDRNLETIVDTAEASGIWINLDSDISVTLSITNNDTTFADNVAADTMGRGQTRGLCLVRTWEDERGIRQFGDVSLAWASTVPASRIPGVTGGSAFANPQVTDTGGATTSIGWDYEIDEGFDYVLRMVTTSRDNDEPDDTADCGGGNAVPSPARRNAQDFPVSHRERRPAPYTHYQLCIRAENDYGASSWVFVGDDGTGGAGTGMTDGAPTRPTSPAIPVYVPGESSVIEDSNRRHDAHRLVWSVSPKVGTPIDGAMFDVTVFSTSERTIPRGTTQDVCGNLRASGLANVEVTDTADNDINDGTTPTRTTNSSAEGGFERWIWPNTGSQILDNEDGTTAAAALMREYYFYACVRAAPTAGDDGPWVISAPTRFVAGTVTAPDAPIPSTVGSGGTTTSGVITWTLPAATWDATVAASSIGYQVEYIKHDAATEAQDSLGAMDFAATDPNHPRVRTGTARNGEFVTRDAAANIYTLRYSYSVRLGSTTVYSVWSAVASDTVE